MEWGVESVGRGEGSQGVWGVGDYFGRQNVVKGCKERMACKSRDALAQIDTTYIRL